MYPKSSHGLLQDHHVVPVDDFVVILVPEHRRDLRCFQSTGDRTALVRVLAEHADVDGVWCFGSEADRETVRAVEEASAGNMKRTWTSLVPRDWYDLAQGEGREFLRRATEVKNIWIPYGE